MGALLADVGNQCSQEIDMEGYGSSGDSTFISLPYFR